MHVCLYLYLYTYIKYIYPPPTHTHTHTHTQFVTNCERSFRVYCMCDKNIQNNLIDNIYTHYISNKRFSSFEIALYARRRMVSPIFLHDMMCCS